MAYFDFVNNAGGADFGFIDYGSGTVYYTSEEQVVTTTLPVASKDMYVAVQYVLPLNGNYINIFINDVQVFSDSDYAPNVRKVALFRLKQGEVLKITCKSYQTGALMSYYTF